MLTVFNRFMLAVWLLIVAFTLYWIDMVSEGQLFKSLLTLIVAFNN